MRQGFFDAAFMGRREPQSLKAWSPSSSTASSTLPGLALFAVLVVLVNEHAESALATGGIEGLRQYYEACQPGSGHRVKTTLERDRRKTLESERERFISIYLGAVAPIADDSICQRVRVAQRGDVVDRAEHGRLATTLARAQLVEQPRVGVHAEAGALGHPDAAALRVDRLAQRIVREVTIEALDPGLGRHRGDAMDRREEPRPEVRRVRDDLDPERLGQGHDPAHLGHAADLGHARLGIGDGAGLERATKFPDRAVVLT